MWKSPVLLSNSTRPLSALSNSALYSSIRDFSIAANIISLSIPFSFSRASSAIINSLFIAFNFLQKYIYTSSTNAHLIIARLLLSNVLVTSSILIVTVSLSYSLRTPEYSLDLSTGLNNLISIILPILFS